MRTPGLGLGLLLLCLPGAGRPEPRLRLAADLRSRMLLSYRSDSTLQPPWTVDSIQFGAAGTGGVFEVPDSSAPGQWVKRTSFELVSITAP